MALTPTRHLYFVREILLPKFWSLGRSGPCTPELQTFSISWWKRHSIKILRRYHGQTFQDKQKDSFSSSRLLSCKFVFKGCSFSEETFSTFALPPLWSSIASFLPLFLQPSYLENLPWCIGNLQFVTLPLPGVTSDISGLVGPVVTAVGQYVQLLESICLLSSGFFFSCVGKLDMCLILYWLVKHKN